MKIITSSASHHAMLFAYVAREAVAAFGSRGEAAISRAVRHYGMQRGRRMALRAEQDGVPVDGRIYDRYGEWACFPGQVELTHSVEDGAYTLHYLRCPWYTEWKRFGMLEYGKYYCGHVDRAIIEGLGLENSMLVGNRLEGCHTCDLKFCDRVYSPEDLQLQQQMDGHEKMPWEYHVGHLYQALRHALQEEFGRDSRRLLKQAMKHYEVHFGPVAKKLVLEYADLDYDLPLSGNSCADN